MRINYNYLTFSYTRKGDGVGYTAILMFKLMLRNQVARIRGCDLKRDFDTSETFWFTGKIPSGQNPVNILYSWRDIGSFYVMSHVVRLSVRLSACLSVRPSVRGKTSLVRSFTSNLFHLDWPFFVSWMVMTHRWSLLILLSVVQRSRSQWHWRYNG